jgi:glycosyltransferase involved in cell wall biosynthesis
MEILRHSALEYGGFDHVILYTPEKIHDIFDTFPDLLRMRGCGYWIWKAPIILKTFQHMQDGDVVMYADSTMLFESNITDCFKNLKKDINLFRLGEAELKQYINSRYTKRDTFHRMDCDSEEYHKAYQVNAAIQVYVKSRTSETFLKDYMKYCADIQCINDASILENHPGFVTHRHDQSVLTNLSVLYGDFVGLSRDITQYGVNDKHPEEHPVLFGECMNHHRVIYGPIVKTMVITPTLGDSGHLERCIESVQKQTLPCVEHMIVVDSPANEARVRQVVARFTHRKPIHVIVLPYNTGYDWYNGHRIYAAMPALCESDYVAYLDDDNWVSPDHYLDMMQSIQSSGSDWCYSLRTIVDRDSGRFLCNDLCESLGDMYISAVNDIFIDTSAYLLKKEIAIALGPIWHAQGEVDRKVARYILDHYTNHTRVTKHSLHYAVQQGRSKSVSPQFFLENNKKYPYDYENKNNLYTYHFLPDKTAQAIVTIQDASRSYVFDEWCQSLLRGLAKKYNIFNAYRVEKIPPGATVLVNLCFLEAIPHHVLQRKDIRRIAYTLESPNIRHQAQWDSVWLRNHFDHILTYWTPLLKDPSFATFYPHNTHHMDFNNPLDMQYLGESPNTKSMCMVLERRDLRGTYSIHGQQLECLDYLREEVVQALAIDVYGRGWETYKDHPSIKPRRTEGRMVDNLKTVDIIKQYTFNVIIENCTADGYVSEKIYDTFIAGAIPVYYGNNNVHVDIPKDMYIDLRQFQTSKDLRTYIDAMTNDQIRAMKQTIAEKRINVLRRVSVQSYADAVDEVYKKLNVD